MNQLKIIFFAFHRFSLRLFKQANSTMDSLFSVAPRQELHSLLVTLESSSWSQYRIQSRPHFLGLTTRLTASRHQPRTSDLERSPSRSVSRISNFHSATSCLLVPRIVPLGRPLLPNRLPCSVLIKSSNADLKADLEKEMRCNNVSNWLIKKGHRPGTYLSI